MALIRCPECGREISDQAQACPGCGFPISSCSSQREQLLEASRQKDRKFLIKAGGLSLLAIVLILGILVLISKGIL